MNTWCPCRTSSCAPDGVIATRSSWSLISRGMPTFMGVPLRRCWGSELPTDDNRGSGPDPRQPRRPRGRRSTVTSDDQAPLTAPAVTVVGVAVHDRAGDRDEQEDDPAVRRGQEEQ